MRGRILMALACAGALAAYPAFGDQAWKGAGTSTCTEFVADFKLDPNTFENVYYQWALGFMSGLNTARATQVRPIVDLNAKDRGPQWQMRYLKQFCDRNPLNRYAEAVGDLYRMLPLVWNPTPK